VQEHCQKPAGSVFLSICLTVPKVFQSHFSYCCQQGTTDLAEVALKLLPSLKTYVACIILFTRQFNCTCMQQAVWQNVFIQTLVIIKNKSFSVGFLPGKDFTDMK